MNDYYENKIEGKVQRTQAHWAFALLLFVVWTRLTVVNYAIAVLYRIPFVNMLAEYAYPVCFGVLLFFAFPYIRTRIRITEIIFYLAAVVVLLMTNLIYADNAAYISYYMSDIVWSFLPMVFLGTLYDHETDEAVLFWASLSGVLVGILYQGMKSSSGQSEHYDSMGLAYRLLPSMMYLAYWAFTRRKFKYWIPVIMSIVFISAYGSRGPILSIVIYLVVGFLYSSTGKHMRYGMFWRVLAVVAVIILASTDILDKVAEFLKELFEGWGLSTRIFDFYLEGDIGNTSGRDALTDGVIDAIQDSPFLGYGIMGDRVLFRSYAHNLILEFWIDYGMIIGTVLLILLGVLIFQAFQKRREQKEYVLFLLMVVCMNFVKLMVSASYITEPYFFFMIGALLAAKRKETAEAVTLKDA